MCGRRVTQRLPIKPAKTNPAKFSACLDTHRFKADVDDDIAAGDEAGVSGTPAFFINGRVLTGAQPFDAFKRVIDDELARKQRR